MKIGIGIIMGWVRDAAVALVAGLALCAAIVVVFWVTDNRPPVRLIAPPEMLTPRVKAGTSATVHWRMLKVRDCDGTVDRAILGGGRTVHLPHDRPIPIQGQIEYVVDFMVPRYLSPGRYEYRAIHRYECNPLHSIVVELPGVEFEIVE